ncbi:MAG: O-antigen ligase family protein [Pseudomonadota bacterium]
MSERGTWLDHLSQRQATRDAQYGATLSVAALWYARVLLVVTTIILMIGLGPVGGADAEQVAGGSRARQASFLLLAALSLPLIMHAWRRVSLLIGANWPLLLVYGVLAASFWWSAFPGITVRRLAIYVIVLLLACALSAVLRTPRLFMPPLLVGFGIVIGLNLVYSAAFPGLAWSPIGLEGLFSSKNVAGMGSQAIILCACATLVAFRSPAAFWSVVLLAMSTAAFLVLTLSKTAVGLTALCVFVVFPVLVLALRHRTFAIIALGGTAGLVGVVGLATGTLNLSGADWADIITGDPTFTSRDELWAAALLHIEKAPLLGYGFGAQWSMLPVYHPLWLYWGFWSGTDIYKNYNQFHNGYLDLFVHGGVLLAGTVAFFVVTLVSRIARAVMRETSDRWKRSGDILFALIVLGTLLSNLMESSLFFPDALLGQFLVVITVAHSAWNLPEGA